MTNVDTLLDEINGRLSAVCVRYPDARLFILSYQKHVKFALEHPAQAKIEKVINKGRKWLTEVMWKHPLFRPEFQKIIDAIDNFEASHR